MSNIFIFVGKLLQIKICLNVYNQMTIFYLGLIRKLYDTNRYICIFSSERKEIMTSHKTLSLPKEAKKVARPSRSKRIPCTCRLCVRHEGVTVDGKKQHICDYKNCNKLFTKTQHLRNHIRSHLGERPFSCNFCDKRFFRHEELTRHKRSHTKEKIYICPQCGKGFTRSDYLTKHMDMHIRRGLENDEEESGSDDLNAVYEADKDNPMIIIRTHLNK